MGVGSAPNGSIVHAAGARLTGIVRSFGCAPNGAGIVFSPVLDVSVSDATTGSLLAIAKPTTQLHAEKRCGQSRALADTYPHDVGVDDSSQVRSHDVE